MVKKPKTKIRKETRRDIADEMKEAQIAYHGKLDEPDFLLRIFSLKDLPSKDRSGRFNNAYDDIKQHTVANDDYPDRWIYSDDRIDLYYCNDSNYLSFLQQTIHPIVRQDKKETEILVENYKMHLKKDGFEVVLLGNDNWTIRPMNIIDRTKEADGIKKYLTTAYVKDKIDLGDTALNTGDTELAIGVSKELLETVCKSILSDKGVSSEPDIKLQALVKLTGSSLSYKSNGVALQAKANTAIAKLVNGVSTIAHGVSELRNDYGTGHGKESDFIPIEKHYASLLVGMNNEISVFFLKVHGESAELVS